VEVSPSMDLTVYRIVQEALTNIRKHSRATSATVDITFDNRGLAVCVVDDGESVLNATPFRQTMAATLGRVMGSSACERGFGSSEAHSRRRRSMAAASR